MAQTILMNTHNYINMIKDKYQRKYYATEKGKRMRREGSRRYYATPRGWYNNYKKWAKGRGKTFNITFEQFEKFVGQDCYFCGNPIETVGIDRLDNNIGYELDNLVSCCTRCNKMKLDMNLVEWLSHMKRITSRFNIKIIKD